MTIRKNRRIGDRTENNSGIILIVVLWILVILSMLAVGLSRKVKVDLTLTKYAIGKIKSRYLATAGLMYAMNQINQDNKDEQTKVKDTKFQCGITLKSTQRVEDLFKEKAVGRGHFTISYNIFDQDQKRSTGYGLEDEESKINLNALNTNNYKTLKYLITEFGFEEEVAETVASSALDWIDADSDVFNSPLGGEKDDYETEEKPYPCKNKPFDSIEELVLVKGMTLEIFKKIKKYITVFPRQGNLLVNFDTSSDVVLKSVARNVTGPQTNTGISDADSLVERMISFRQGADGKFGTEDDQVIDGNVMGLSPTENAVFQAMAYNRTSLSNYLRVHVKGVDEASKISSSIDAVIQRQDLSLVYWRRN